MQIPCSSEKLNLGSGDVKVASKDYGDLNSVVFGSLANYQFVGHLSSNSTM